MPDNSSQPGHKWLRPLADLLIARHINASVPDHELKREMLAGEAAMWAHTERKFRCIAVVGAGASAPVLERGEGLAKGLMQRFHVDEDAIQAERERLERITAVNPEEFEAQLSAIGQTMGGDRRVRAAISELYQVRHPTIQSYELIAHLLKHRFLDAVISMNFDELLDQSLDDELGVGEYQRIVSDRDCVSVQTNELAADHLPLYIKLHGTASEPESLRFTRESYYDSPVQVGAMAAELFQVPECVVINVGFGMGSFDLHRLLAMPEKLWLFNLSKEELDKNAVKAIKGERKNRAKDRPDSKACAEKKKRKDFFKLVNDHQGLCDVLLTALLDHVEQRGKKLLEKAPGIISLRSVKRHDAVVSLLGPESGPGRRLIELPRSADDARFSIDPAARASDPDAVYAGYLLRRAILELALAMARGRGLVSVGTLAVDRGGHYFDAYRRYAVECPWSWQELYTLIGFKQSPGVPDVFQATEKIQASARRPGGPNEKKLLKRLIKTNKKNKKKRAKEKNKKIEKSEWQKLPGLDIPGLVDRVLPHIVDDPKSAHSEALTGALEKLYEGTEYELHSRDDRVCAKTFDRPLTLKTLSAFDAYSFKVVTQIDKDKGENVIDIISETGDWLRKREKSLGKHLRSAKKIRLIVAFLCDVPYLYELFPNIEIRFQQPWHHNRHMVIVKDAVGPPAAIYFARHHRTPYVTPVFVCRRGDVEVVQTAFDDRWKKATELTR
jgi:hypothetical protein